jgi:hypothetical protein
MSKSVLHAAAACCLLFTSESLSRPTHDGAHTYVRTHEVSRLGGRLLDAISIWGCNKFELGGKLIICMLWGQA